MRTLLTRITRSLALAVAFGTTPALARDVDSKPTIEQASVTRTSTGAAVVQWRTAPVGAPVDVAIVLPGEGGSRLVSDDDADGVFELSMQDAARRPLVHLTTPSGRAFITAERLLPLQGGRNFRDLGGYTTANGRRVKWGHIYRSGTMSNLTEDDYRFLSTLGIRVVCDFRANEEREREPTLWRTSGHEIQYLTRDYTTESNLRGLFGDGVPTAGKVRAGMLSIYDDLPYEHADSYRRMFKAVAKGEAPLAFNCSAGKDRTGVAAALLLTMLGVPRSTILEDYALSERVVNYEAAYAANSSEASPTPPGPWDFIRKLPADVRAPLLRSDPEYVRSALEHIEARESSIDAYFSNVLGLSTDEQRRIRELLLDSHQ